MACGRRGRMILTPLLAHRRRPALWAAQFFWKPWVLEHPVHDHRHVLVAPGERWIMSQTDCEYFAHLATSVRRYPVGNFYIPEAAGSVDGERKPAVSMPR